MPAFQGCCAHDHDCEEADCGPSWSLHEHIDLPRVSVLECMSYDRVRHKIVYASGFLMTPYDMKKFADNLYGRQRMPLDCDVMRFNCISGSLPE